MKKVKEKILDLLKISREVYQSELVRATGFSKSRVSEVLSELEKKNLIVRTNVGRNSKIVLKTNIARRGKIIRLGFVRAAEYPFLVPLRNILRERSYQLEFVVRENGIDVMMDLLFARVDAAIAPALTQFVFYSIGTPLKIIGPAGSGGSSLLTKKDLPSDARIIST